MKSCLKILRYAIILFLTCVHLSCSDSEPVNRCLIADSATITGRLSVEDKTFYLVYRISGWHEKIEIFELYNTEPTFDNCGQSAIAPLFAESIDEKDESNNIQHVAHIYLMPPGSLDFEYAPGAPPTSNHHRRLALEWRGTQ